MITLQHNFHSLNRHSDLLRCLRQEMPLVRSGMRAIILFFLFPLPTPLKLGRLTLANNNSIYYNMTE